MAYVFTGTAGADSYSATDPTGGTISGLDGADTLSGFTGPDTIYGGTGNDQIAGNSGNDLLFGEEGQDSIVDTGGNDTIVGGFDADQIQIRGAGDHVILGNQGNDVILIPPSLATAPGANTIYGGMGDDFIFARDEQGRSQFVYGGEGSDNILANDFGTGNVTVVGGVDSLDGPDQIQTGFGDDLVLGNGGDDHISDFGGTNTLIGGFGNDTISGSPGFDFMQGNEGNDQFDAFGGVNTLTGGTGNDTFIIRPQTDGTSAAPVVITDLVWGTDQIDVPTVPVAVGTPDIAGASSLTEAASNAIASVQAANGLPATSPVAAQFTFSGSTYLVVNEAGAGFADADDILLNVTGVTGQIGTSSFT